MQYVFEDGAYSPLTKGNSLAFTESGESGASWMEGAVSPIEAHILDSKMDDGIPGTGDVYSRNGLLDATATTQVCLNGSAYDLSTEVAGCWINFWVE